MHPTILHNLSHFDSFDFNLATNVALKIRAKKTTGKTIRRSDRDKRSAGEFTIKENEIVSATSSDRVCIYIFFSSSFENEHFKFAFIN